MSTSTLGTPEDKAERMKINEIRASSLALRYFHEHILPVTKTKGTSTGRDFGPPVHQVFPDFTLIYRDSECRQVLYTNPVLFRTDYHSC